MIFDLHSYIFGILTGMVVGIGSVLVLTKQKMELSKKVALLLFIIGLLMHIFALATGSDIPYMFDIIWVGGTGHLIGINTIEGITKAFGKKK